MSHMNKFQCKIEFKDVTKNYQSTIALNQIDLKIPNHKIMAVVGPSGSGKTTLLRLINRLIKPTSGQILLNNRLLSHYPVRKIRLKTGNLFQRVALFPNLTVNQNITLQLKILHLPREKRLKIAQHLLTNVGLDSEYGTRYPRKLSGGEQQRIGVARALATQPQLILMDEPFSALDPINRRKLQDLVLKLHRKLHNTIVFVTHDMHEALKMGQRIAVLYHGKIVQVGTADDLLQRPRSPLVNRLFHYDSVRDVVKQGYAQYLQRTSKKQLISANESIPQLAEQLKDKSKINVRCDGQDWQVTTSELLAFIAHQEDHYYE